MDLQEEDCYIVLFDTIFYKFYDICIMLYHYIVLLDSILTLLWYLHLIVLLYCVIEFIIDNSMVFTSHCIIILCYLIQC